jgi:4-hydroxy-tetrahydrodipicolinate synthase
MDGVISVAANAFPKPFSDMIKFSMAGDFSMAKRINDLMVEGYAYMYEENNPAGIKAFMAEQGLIQNELRLPLVPVSAGLQERIKHYLQRFMQVIKSRVYKRSGSIELLLLYRGANVVFV